MYRNLISLTAALVAFVVIVVFSTPPSMSDFGVFLGVAGTMLALTVAAHELHSSTLDRWISFYGDMYRRGLEKLEKNEYTEDDIKNYQTGKEILQEKSQVSSYMKNACCLVLLTLIASAIAISFSLIFLQENSLQAFVLRILWATSVITLVWSGGLLGFVTYKSIKADLRRTDLTVSDLNGLVRLLERKKKEK
jgi:hypothetical protein